MAVRVLSTWLTLLALAAAGAEPGPAARGTTFRLEKLATAREPVYVTSAPGEADRLYVVQRRGLVRVLAGGAFEAEPFLDVTSLVSTRGEEGLLSIAFHPGYARNRVVFAAYTDRRGAIEVVRYRVENGRVAGPRTLLVIPHPDSPYHNGGLLAFGPDRRLYLGTGDGGYAGVSKPTCSGKPRVCRAVSVPDPHGNSQNPSVRLGKLLRIDSSTGAVTTVAYGLRNPWRFSFDGPTGDLYLGDVGWNRAEEVDYVPAARFRPLLNFGWSVYEGTAKRTSSSVPKLDTAGRLVWPLLTYAHPPTSARGCSASITGGYVYHGQAISDLDGRYVYGDYCSGRIWSLRTAGGRLSDRRAEPVRVPLLVSFGEDAAGELLAVSLAGAVYRLVPA